VHTLHGSCTCHWIFSTYTDTKNQEGEGIADDPAIQCCPPHGRQHYGSKKHRCCILYDSPSSADEVSDDADHDLAADDMAADDTDDLQVVDRMDPGFAADCICFVTLWPSRLEQRDNIAN
jgi:hypothetical protein